MRSLLELLSVEPAVKDAANAVDRVDVFVGAGERYGPLGVYGGHLLGQALSAAFATVELPKLAHSMHAYFLRPANPDLSIQYEVENLRDSRGSAVRTVLGSQEGQKVFHLTASFKLPEDGDVHQPEMPEVEAPEVLHEKTPLFAPPPTQHGRMETVLTGEPFERPDFQPGREALIRMWIRCPGSVDVTPRDAQIVLAYVSDTVLLMPSVIPHGLPFTTHRMASIDHSVWFHGIPDVADWMLYDLCSSAAIDGRGMNHGTLFDRAGRLLLTAAQESMLRRN